MTTASNAHPHNSDPVFEENGAWYFWNEVWVDCHGPFPDERTARAKLREYAATL